MRIEAVIADLDRSELQAPMFRDTEDSEHRLGLNVDLPFSCSSYQTTMFNADTAGGGAVGSGGIFTHADHYHLRFADWKAMLIDELRNT